MKSARFSVGGDRQAERLCGREQSSITGDEAKAAVLFVVIDDALLLDVLAGRTIRRDPGGAP